MQKHLHRAYDRMYRPWATNPGLRPFRGTFLPGVCFESGHCVVLVDFAETPTRHGAYREVWLLAPDGTRTLVCSDRGAIPTVERYHDFDRAAEGDVVVARRGSALALAVSSHAFTLELTAELPRTLSTRVASALSLLTPGALLRVGAVRRLAEGATARLLGESVALVGETETGARFRTSAKGVRRVRNASARLDGEDLGEMAPPDRRIAFGDTVVPERPLLVRGTMALQHP